MAMKKFSVNFTRVVTIEGTIEVAAKDVRDAEERTNQMIDNGKFGFVTWKLKDAHASVKDAEIASEQDDITVDDAYESEE